ncbi:MAG: vanadium-dependent haloperoxidase [Gemmatimonadaceae bacterium]
MRYAARLLTLTLLAAVGNAALAAAQTKPASSSVPLSVRWNRLVPVFSDEAAANRKSARAAAAGDAAALRRLAQTPAPFPFTIYTLLSTAQYAAVTSARESREVSEDAAIANASAAVLSQIFTDSAVRASIARELARDVQSIGLRAPDRALAAKRLGEDVAGRVIAWAPTLIMVAPWNGTIPKGPGMWYSAPNVPPIGLAMATSRTYLLDSSSQFRPAAPPPFGSEEWKSAMEEVRRVARNRTPEQTKSAQYWNSGDPWAVWNETAANAIARSRMSDADAVRVLAILNAAATDAAIACFDAKYYYWTIRPSQADTTLELADDVGLPNFPSFPSKHACSAGAFDAVLGHFFPKQRAQFTVTAEEQAMSRLYGGIHYRFDNDGGLKLGRVVARYDIDKERRGGFNAWRNATVTGKQ